jgi:hypothetical protein
VETVRGKTGLFLNLIAKKMLKSSAIIENNDDMDIG